MALTVKSITIPAALSGQSNGRLSASLLSSTPGLSGGPTVRLLTVAARAWRALAAAAQHDGIILKATSYADSYRTYDQQVALFTSRYQTDPTLNGWRLWDSDGNGVAERWYKKDNVASAAVPGTSNHGWALAVDISGASGSRLAWLEDHALAYGWSWELVPEEPWHVHYYSGDMVPAAVLAYEEGLAEMTPEEHQRLEMADADTRVLLTGSPTIGTNPFYAADKPVWIVGQVTALAAKVDQILALLQAGGGPGGLTEQQAEDAAFRGAQRAEDE